MTDVTEETNMNDYYVPNDLQHVAVTLHDFVCNMRYQNEMGNSVLGKDDIESDDE